MSTFSFPVRDLIITSAVASETTAATFIASASAGEVAILNKDGQTAAAYGSDAYILSKDLNGRVKSSDTLIAGSIKKVTKVDPVTIVPAYASIPITAASVTATAAKDVWEGLIRIQEFGSRSAYDEYPAPFNYVAATGDTVDTVTEGLIKSLSFEFGRVEGKHDMYVNFKTGYKAVYKTEALAEAAIGALTDGDLVWVMENNKPWTVSKTAGTTFASDFTEKTDWSSELTAGTAEYLNANPWFHFIKLDGSDVTLYVIAKNQPTTDMKLEGYDINFRVGLRVLDGTSFEEDAIITVTNVGKVGSPGEGKNIRRLETFTKGHTGDFYRGMGYPNNFDATYDAVVTTNYYLVNVEFQKSMQDVNSLSGDPSQKVLQIACSTSGAATAVYNALNGLINKSIALGDLSDVTFGTLTTGEVVKYDTDHWENAADAT